MSWATVTSFEKHPSKMEALHLQQAPQPHASPLQLPIGAGSFQLVTCSTLWVKPISSWWSLSEGKDRISFVHTVMPLSRSTVPGLWRTVAVYKVNDQMIRRMNKWQETPSPSSV